MKIVSCINDLSLSQMLKKNHSILVDLVRSNVDFIDLVLLKKHLKDFVEMVLL